MEDAFWEAVQEEEEIEELKLHWTALGTLKLKTCNLAQLEEQAWMVLRVPLEDEEVHLWEAALLRDDGLWEEVGHLKDKKIASRGFIFEFYINWF